MYRLLIVNKKESSREMQKAYLEQSQLEIDTIHECTDGIEMMMMLKEHKPQIVVMERNILETMGSEAISVIQEVNAKCKIILITGGNSLDYILNAFRKGVTEILISPVDKEMYCTAINKAIDQLDEAERQKENKTRSQKVQSILERRILKELETGICDEEYLYMLGLKRICGCCYYLKAEQEILTYRDIVENVLRTSFQEVSYKCIFSVGDKHVNIILFINKEPERYAMCKNMENIIMHLFEALNIEFTLSSGIWFDTIEEIANAFLQSNQVFDTSIDGDLQGNAGTRSAYPEEVDKVTTYIKEHYCERLTLESIAKSVGFSKSYISRQFKQYKGITIMEYVIRKRIEQAKQLLKEGDWSIKQISYALGYSDPNYFTWSFKKQVGISPMQYRYEQD